jgi:hypothetical protein
MAFLDKDTIRYTRARNTVIVDEAPIAPSNTIYVGGAVCFNSSGSLVAASSSAGFRPAGICSAILNESGAPISVGTGNSAGTVKAQFEYNHEALFAYTSATGSYLMAGKNIFINTDNDMTDTTGSGAAAARQKFGSIAEFNGSLTSVWVAVRKFGDSDA